MRIFIGKHPCDDLPVIEHIDPDPRSEQWQRFIGPEGEDYSGWFAADLDALGEYVGLLIGEDEFIPKAIVEQHLPFAAPPGTRIRGVYAQPVKVASDSQGKP